MGRESSIMEYKDYYKIMGVSKDAAQDEIKRSYRKLARKYHPDVSKEADAEARFKEVNEAYEVLKDPEKRAAYDQLGQQWKQGQEFRPPPGWDTGFEFSGGGFTGTDQGHFSDFFEALFGMGGATGRAGGRARGGFQMRGEDHHAKIMVTIEDAYQGATRTLQLQMPVADAQGHVQLTPRTVRVKIPRGVKAGQHIRLSGQGGAGMGNGPAGDLYLEIQLEPHRLYRPEGRDVYVNLPLAPWEAALGDTVAVPTLGGTVDLKIPAGSQPGQKLRLKGRGLPGEPAGDQYVVLRIVTPPAKDEASRDFYRRMQTEMPFDPRKDMGG